MKAGNGMTHALAGHKVFWHVLSWAPCILSQLSCAASRINQGLCICLSSVCCALSPCQPRAPCVRPSVWRWCIQDCCPNRWWGWWACQWWQVVCILLRCNSSRQLRWLRWTQPCLQLSTMMVSQICFPIRFTASPKRKMTAAVMWLLHLWHLHFWNMHLWQLRQLHRPTQVGLCCFLVFCTQ